MQSLGIEHMILELLAPSSIVGILKWNFYAHFGNLIPIPCIFIQSLKIKIKMWMKTWLLRPSLYVKLSIYTAQMLNVPVKWFCFTLRGLYVLDEGESITTKALDPSGL